MLFPDREMVVLPFHRRVGDVLGRPAEELLDSLSGLGAVEERDGPEASRPDERGKVGIYLEGRWFSLQLPEATSDRVVDQLDVARLQGGVLAPLFGIANPEVESQIDYLPDPAGLDTLARLCDVDGRVGFITYPLSVAEMMSVADAGALMPPKSSYFQPKPLSGVVVRRLDREINSGAS